MLQKYIVYLNGKALFFNNPQAVYPQGDGLVDLPGTGRKALDAAVDLLSDTEPLTRVRLPGLSLEEGLALLRLSHRFVTAAGGIVEAPGKHILCIYRLGCWDLPKGKAEPGEAPEETAAREITEETGVGNLIPAGSICKTWHTYRMKGTDYLKETHWFHFKVDAMAPLVAQTEEAITEAAWIGPDRLEEIKKDTYPSVRDVIGGWELGISY